MPRILSDQEAQASEEEKERKEKGRKVKTKKIVMNETVFFLDFPDSAGEGEVPPREM